MELKIATQLSQINTAHRVLPFNEGGLNSKSLSADEEARSLNLYGVEILRCAARRQIRIATQKGPRWVLDYATNSPFALNLDTSVVRGALNAVKQFGALHASIAAARAQTGIAAEILQRLISMKRGASLARLYPTTFAANIATAAGFAKMDCTVVMHPNVHATVQFAVEGAFSSDRIIRTKNTGEVATAFAKTTLRPVVIIEDGLYSMGKFADFKALQNFLKARPRGWVWLDDAHAVGMRGKDGRGEAMEQMEAYADRCVVTASLGKAFGAAGGFMVAPSKFVQTTLSVSVADRFSCNLDLAAQGAVLAAMKILAVPKRLERLDRGLKIRLKRVDAALAAENIFTEQADTPIAFRVVPFASPSQAIQAAGILLEKGILTTPVYYPTIAPGKGAIRISLSSGHRLADVDFLLEQLVPLLKSQNEFVQFSEARAL